MSAEQDCYMLDTNTVSRILRKDSVVLNRRIAGMRMDRLCISSITEAELYYGLEKTLPQLRCGRLLKPFLSVSTLCRGHLARRAFMRNFELPANLANTRRKPGSVDCIACH